MKSGDTYNIYIFGAGYEYNRLSSYLPLYSDIFNIMGIVTTKRQGFSCIDGLKNITIEEIDVAAMDYIIIAVIAWKEIKEKLLSIGIEDKKIIRSNVFYNPCFGFKEYIKLKSSNVSIFSNFCLGGTIYRELGLKVLSPTVNMFCLGEEYIQFLREYEVLLKSEMKEYISEQYISGTLGCESFYQRGILDDRIIWYFNHNQSASDAIVKWNERVKRINYSNIAMLMTIQTDEAAYEFDKLPIKKKLGVYHKDLNLESVIYCSDWNDSRVRYQSHGNWPAYANRYMSNSDNLAGAVNWIKFLNGDNDYKRYT